jgi:protein-tyrosine phosphatase
MWTSRGAWRTGVNALTDALPARPGSQLELRITHVLCVAVDLPHPYPHDFTYMTVPVLDSPEADLRRHFDSAFVFIDEALQSGQGGVLVHCFAGRSRSVTVAVGYLMRRERLSMQAALDAVLAVRPIAQPNSGFMQLLARFEEEEARRGARVHNTRASSRHTCALG